MEPEEAAPWAADCAAVVEELEGAVAAAVAVAAGVGSAAAGALPPAASAGATLAVLKVRAGGPYVMSLSARPLSFVTGAVFQSARDHIGT